MSYYLNGRAIVYTNEVPFETDILSTNNFNMAGVSGLAQTILGFGINEATTVRGLPCTPVSPPGLAVVVGPGVMYSLEDYDATDYGVIPADTNSNHQLYKQAFNWNPVTLNVTAPSTPGDSVIYLIEGIFDTVDVNNVSRPYFNSADPTMPIFNNNYDTRTDTILFQAKQGVPGVSPTPPTPDAGYTGLYYVTVTNGQTAIISGNIAKVSTVEGQPFITEGLTQKISSGTIAGSYVSIPAQQANSYIYGNDVGSVNTVVVTPVNVYAPYSAGTVIEVLIANTNNGPTTLNINGNGAIAVQVATPLGLLALNGNELVSGCIARFLFNGTTFQLMNPACNTLLYSQVSFNSTTAQSISASSTQKIQFNNVLHNTLGWWDSVNFRMIPNIKGDFEIICNVCCGDSSIDSQGVKLYKNGSFFRYMNIEFNSGTSAGPYFSAMGNSGIIAANGSTDYFELFWQNDGNSATLIGSRFGVDGEKNLFELRYLGN